MPQNPAVTYLNSWLKDKYNEDALYGVFLARAMALRDPLMRRFFNIKGKGENIVNRAEYQQDITGSGVVKVPVQLEYAVNAWGPIADLNADNPIAYEDEPTTGFFLYPTEKHYGFQVKIFPKDNQLFNNQPAVMASNIVRRNKINTLFGQFLTFWRHMAFKLYRSQGTADGVVLSYGNTIDIGGTTYHVLNLDPAGGAPRNPALPFQQGMKVDIYNAAGDTLLHDSITVYANSANSIITTTDVSLLAAGSLIFKEDTKDNFFKGWEDFVKAPGVILGLDISQYWNLQPVRITSAITIQVGSDTNSVWRPLEAAVEEYTAKTGGEAPDTIIIPTKYKEYLRRDIQLRGMQNIILNFNENMPTWNGGIRVGRYDNIMLEESANCQSNKLLMVKDKNENGDPNFENVVWGKRMMIADEDGAGNIFKKDQKNLYAQAMWYTLFDNVIWPFHQGEVTNIVYS